MTTLGEPTVMGWQAMIGYRCFVRQVITFDLVPEQGDVRTLWSGWAFTRRGAEAKAARFLAQRRHAWIVFTGQRA